MHKLSRLLEVVLSTHNTCERVRCKQLALMMIPSPRSQLQANTYSHIRPQAPCSEARHLRHCLGSLRRCGRAPVTGGGHQCCHVVRPHISRLFLIHTIETAWKKMRRAGSGTNERQQATGSHEMGANHFSEDGQVCPS